LENLEAEADIKRTWESIWESIEIPVKESLGYCELKKHKPWFQERLSELLDKRKRAKMQCLEDPGGISGDTLNNTRRESRRQFSKKKKAVPERQH
jgi:hypothetical protein